MANKPSPSSQHKHLAVLIDADNASVVIAENFIESDKTVDKLRVVHPTHDRATCSFKSANYRSRPKQWPRSESY